jgi:hyperosmotically inducible periplasmic protein
MELLHDAELTFKIKAALVMDERIGAGRINVNTVDGVVTLQGAVPNQALRAVAEGVAVRQGARRVVNELALEDRDGQATVASLADGLPRVTTPAGAPVDDRPPLAESVRAALAADRRVNEHLIYVEAENGAVYLTGRQETVDAVDAATEVATHVPGVVAVNNDLEVMPSI